MPLSLTPLRGQLPQQCSPWRACTQRQQSHAAPVLRLGQQHARLRRSCGAPPRRRLREQRRLGAASGQPGTAAVPPERICSRCGRPQRCLPAACSP